jgi:hypothetical protein
MTRHVAFACTIARPKARDTPGSGHPAPTSLPCQPIRFHLPAPHQANPPSAQHSATEQERAETARQGSLTVTFTARKSPVQATSHARQPAPAARRYLFQSSFHLRPTAGKAVSVQAHVGRNCPLAQDSLACKRSFLFWQGANDTATLHHPYNSTTAGKAQRPKHPPTFTHHRRQGRSRQVAFACNIARPQPGKRLGNGHPAPTGHPCRPTPLDLPASRQANQSPGSALRRGTVAGGDSRASHPDRNVHRPKTTRAGKTPRQATHESHQSAARFVTRI